MKIGDTTVAKKLSAQSLSIKKDRSPHPLRT